MAKGAYIGVGGVARKIKKGYIGVGDVARKIKKGYIGVGGVARPFWSGGELVHYGKVGDLGKGRSPVGAALAGGVLVFPGGRQGSSTGSQYVDSVNASLTVSTNQYGTSARYYDAVASAGGAYALSAGGTTGSSRYSYQNSVYAFNSAMTKTTAAALSKKPIVHAGASNTSYAVFAGGDTYESNADPSNFADAYNSSLTKTALAVLVSACSYHTGASFGNLAVMAGGMDANNKTLTGVTTYNTSLTKQTTTLSTGRSDARGTMAGNHLLIAGGFVSGTGASKIVDAFDTSLTRTSAPSLSTAQDDGPTGITTLKGFAMFMGGNSICEVYDESLTRTATFDIGATHGTGGAGVVGDYLVVGGGGSYSTRIDAFTVA